MTQRNNYNPSPIEQAVEDVCDMIGEATARAYRRRQPPMPEETFRSLLAHVLENMSRNDWRRRLGLTDDPEGHD